MGEKSLLSPKITSYKFDWIGSLNILRTTREEENIQTACCLPMHLVSCKLTWECSAFYPSQTIQSCDLICLWMYESSSYLKPTKSQRSHYTAE